VKIPGSGEHQVTRITGTAFHDKESLKKFVKKFEEAKKIDHRHLGKEKDLYLLEKTPIWLPKGMKIRETHTDWWKKEHLAQGYSLVKAPSHRDVFNHFKHSNRDFPVRYAEISEKSHTREHGLQNSLTNSSIYTHDTATTFCLKEQVGQEINKSLQFIRKTSNILGFGYQWYLVAQNNRDKAIEPLVEGLKQSGISYTTEVHKALGSKSPRIEVRWADFLGREWLGQTLSLEYHDNIAMITRSVFSSLERCIALLVEHYAMTKENVAEPFEQQ
jgi:threonyl-tRNA synthetase